MSAWQLMNPETVVCFHHVAQSHDSLPQINCSPFKADSSNWTLGWQILSCVSNHDAVYSSVSKVHNIRPFWHENSTIEQLIFSSCNKYMEWFLQSVNQLQNFDWAHAVCWQKSISVTLWFDSVCAALCHHKLFHYSPLSRAQMPTNETAMSKYYTQITLWSPWRRTESCEALNSTWTLFIHLFLNVGNNY